MADAAPAGMIGLGNMGGRIARRIRDGGYPIVGYDASAAGREQSGVTATASVADLVSSAPRSSSSRSPTAGSSRRSSTATAVSSPAPATGRSWST